MSFENSSLTIDHEWEDAQARGDQDAESCTSINYNKLKPTVSWERKEMPWTMCSSCEDSTMSCGRIACGSVYN